MNTHAAEFFEKVAALVRERQPFAVATVVSRRAPVSAHLGDRAIVYADGRMEGFVGGACSREIVRKQALELLTSRHARLVSIRPDGREPDVSDPEHVTVPLSCASEGAIDVYIEPFVLARRLVIVGATPVAESLARTAVNLNYDVVRVVEADEQRDVRSELEGVTVAPLQSLDELLQYGGEVAAVVASQGHYDEEALQTILRSGASYVGLVASRKRGDTIREVLEGSGVTGVELIRYPAGLDLGARTPPEVALSILAEIVKSGPAQRVSQSAEPALSVPSRGELLSGGRVSGRTTAGTDGVQSGMSSQGKPTSQTARAGSETVGQAIDPVCGMTVEIATARHTADVEGIAYYFCSAQCRMRLVQNPRKFLPVGLSPGGSSPQ